jgi:hypothetical protein
MAFGVDHIREDSECVEDILYNISYKFRAYECVCDKLECWSAIFLFDILMAISLFFTEIVGVRDIRHSNDPSVNYYSSSLC